VIEPVFD